MNNKNRPGATGARYVFVGMLVLLSLTSCRTWDRLQEVDRAPELSTITNPKSRPGYQPVSMPAPPTQNVAFNPNSLWRSGSKTFFKDHRAKQVGDILTVKMNIEDSAVMNNKTERARALSEDASLSAILGLEKDLSKALNNFDPEVSVDLESDHATEGDGALVRDEEINLSIAAVVTQILPNGALVIHGRQEVRVNYEIREINVTGVIRPEDIDPDNSIQHQKIAEMRVAYGGRGTISDLQQPRWGTQLFDILYPF